MADNGLLFVIRDHFGERVRVPLADVALLIHLLQFQSAGRPGAVEARRTLQLALHRADEVRHWIISDEASAGIVWAIHDEWDHAAVPDGLVALRHALIDYLHRKEPEPAA